ncbi:class I SAM-dependent methyltransferase [Nonomuraea maheshkhaliensis]|uniref:Class I SAM-dependent methyltransferase n=2 Tax=Nonomuraea maheshkhaliensis TaxID=419590 RepID=A0ABP4R777_9ACTN
MPAEHAERIRRWHENAYRAMTEEGAAGLTFAYLGRTIVVPPGVQPITGMSHLLGEAVLAEVREGDRVLDMGTGSGVNAVLAASRAAEVLAVDVNPRAVEAARGNAERNGVQVEVRLSDVFSAVEGTFDLIVFDPPFRWFAPRDLFEAATTDEDYRAMTAFFRGVRDHLAPCGRMLVFFGTSGDLEYLRSLAREAGFGCEVVARQGLDKEGWRVDYHTFLMRWVTRGGELD